MCVSFWVCAAQGTLVMTAKRQLHSKAITGRVAEAQNRAAAARAKALTLAHQQGDDGDDDGDNGEGGEGDDGDDDGDARACKLARRNAAAAAAADLAGTAAFGRFRDPAFFVQVSRGSSASLAPCASRGVHAHDPTWYLGG